MALPRLTGQAMNYPENNEVRPADAASDRQKQIPDGSDRIEEPGDEPAPRVRGLIELFNEFFAARQRD